MKIKIPVAKPYVKRSLKGFYVNDTEFMEKVLEKTCAFFELEKEKVIARNRFKSRKRELAFARQISMYIIHCHSRVTLKDIGRFFSNRDHSTVLYCLKKVNDYIDINDEATIEAISGIAV